MQKLATWQEAEYSVIGALLLKPSVGLELEIGPQHFASDDLRLVFEAIQSLQISAEPIDVLTVSERLERSTGRQWLAFLGEIARETPSAANATAYAKFLLDAYRSRRALEIANALIENAQNPAAIDVAVKDLMAISRSRKTFECNARIARQEAMDMADDASHGITGAPTGLSDLDRKLGGFHRGDLIVIGARPGIGKTAFMCNLAMKGRVKAGIISAEQGHAQIGQRMLAIGGKISLHAMRVGAASSDDFARMAVMVNDELGEMLWINDNSAITLMELQRQARKWKFERDIQALYVDYLQRIKAGDSKTPRREQVGEVARGLKELARELDIPVIVLGQLNRDVERRAERKPVVSDLAESGEIEREADQIMLLYRDDEMNGNTMDVFVGKNRHGPMGRIELAWIADCMAVESLERRY